jgi:ketosteroid isomerase-like protein
MSNPRENHRAKKLARRIAVLLVGFALAGICVSPAAAQKEKKKKPEPATDANNSKVLSTLTDEQQIDYTLSDMLGAWQLGDVEKLRQDYGDDAAVVNGVWAPPVIGWTNYLAVYQQQRARMQQVRMDRTNTYIKVSGNVGWACYQWDFEAVVDGQQTQSQGQTTVVLEKRNNRWVIVLNHTSLAQHVPAGSQNATPAAQQPTKPTPN